MSITGLALAASGYPLLTMTLWIFVHFILIYLMLSLELGFEPTDSGICALSFAYQTSQVTQGIIQSAFIFLWICIHSARDEIQGLMPAMQAYHHQAVCQAFTWASYIDV